MGSNINITKGIKFISVYNIVLGSLSISVLPITILMTETIQDKKIVSPLIYGLFPMIAIGVFYIISGVLSLKKYRFGTTCLMISSIIQFIMGIYLTLESYMIPKEEHLIINYILIVVGLWAIIYLKKPEIKGLLGS